MEKEFAFEIIYNIENLVKTRILYSNQINIFDEFFETC